MKTYTGYILKFSDEPDHNGNIISKDCEIEFEGKIPLSQSMKYDTGEVYNRFSNGAVVNMSKDDIGIKGDISISSKKLLKIIEIMSVRPSICGGIKKRTDKKIECLKLDEVSITALGGDPDLKEIKPEDWNEVPED
jgi:hypothetical protein